MNKIIEINIFKSENVLLQVIKILMIKNLK